jgi:YggT family protein
VNAILDFLQFIIDVALEVMIWIVIAYAVLSWLIGFDVINLRNRFVYRASRFLESAARPLLRPFQRLLPTPGGLDFSPLIFIVLVVGVQRYLIPALFNELHMLAGPRIVAL